MDDWVPISGFPGYSVNTFGQVRRDLSGRVLKVQINQFGFPYVGLIRDSRQHKRSLALLVAKAFIPKPYTAFDTPIRLDGDPFNCFIDNLVWRPRWFAIQYAHQFVERYHRPVEAPLRAIDSKAVFRDSFAVSKRYGLLERDVVLSIENHTWTWPTYTRFELVE